MLQIERRLTSKVPELIKTYQTQMKQLQDVYQQLLQLKPQLNQVISEGECVQSVSVNIFE